MYKFEVLQIIRCITFNKIINAIKLQLSFYISKFTKNPVVWAMPYSISVEPANKCNLSCPLCPTGNATILRPKAKLSFLNYTQIIDSLHSNLFYLQLYLQGEPFLHPELPDMIAYATGKKICTSVSTNGHFISEEKAMQIVKSGLTKLIISLDGADSETYQKYRVGGDFGKVISAIKNMVKAKQALKSNYPIIEIQFIVFSFNEHQIKAIHQIGKQLKVNAVKLKSAQIYNFESESALIPKLNKYSRYFQNRTGKWEIKSKLENSCHRMWTNPVIDATGNIMPCCFDKNGDFTMGNILSTSFAEIWNSGNYIDFRKKIFFNRKGINMCRNCTEGLRK